MNRAERAQERRQEALKRVSGTWGAENREGHSAGRTGGASDLPDIRSQEELDRMDRAQTRGQGWPHAGDRERGAERDPGGRGMSDGDVLKGTKVLIGDANLRRGPFWPAFLAWLFGERERFEHLGMRVTLAWRHGKPYLIRLREVRQ